MASVITVFHFLICIFMIIIVLLQAGKGADIGATFGGGGSQTVFGPRGAATFLSKLTTVAAILFLLTSGYLAWLPKHSDSGSVIENYKGDSQTPQTLPSESAPAESQRNPETQAQPAGGSTSQKPESRPAAPAMQNPVEGNRRTR